ncbi:hypothetical protein HPB50_005252 [Hyalomma asiaticum]|uniref:Uncharacterized protein n=1 Tax=Hyalomma asiaticum TaxID=266040 RepID=A0ACB7T0Q6_HYAAI|nr:hypothetical protein HPB50_005252 [Hyalomma asiaticum]
MTWYDLSSFVDHREHLLEEAFGALSPDELNILTPVELQRAAAPRSGAIYFTFSMRLYLRLEYYFYYYHHKCIRELRP